MVDFTDSANYKCLENLEQTCVDYYLSYCGKEICPPGKRFGPRVRNKYVIHVITSGKGCYHVNGRTFELGANQAFLISPGVETVYEADSDDPWSYFWVGFHGIKSAECMSNAGFTPEQPFITLCETKRLEDCVTQMLRFHQLTFSNELKRISCLMQFLALLIEERVRDFSTGSGGYDYPGSVYVNLAIHYLSCNYDKKIKITDLANYIGINRSYLTNNFKKITGVSPQEFLLELRMNKAASLLQETGLSVHDVAEHVGYDDALAFSKVFKQRLGVSPREYRNLPEQLAVYDTKQKPAAPLPL